jgi:arylsulfatase A-like enzyme
MLLTGRGLFQATRSPDSGEIPSGYIMWPEVFRAAGYKTIGIGKWHNDRASYTRAFSAGGPVFFGGMGDHAHLRVYDYTTTHSHVARTYSSTLFADAAIAHIRASKAQPFVMYVAFTVPHDPRVPPPAYARRYAPRTLPVPPNFMHNPPFDNGEMDVRDEHLLPRPLTRAALKRELAAYYAMITHLDAQIGRILRTLRETGLAENTIIVYAGDNGLALGSNGLLGKQNLYEHSLRVPLILAGPGIPAGESGALCYLYDLYPTFCELTGLSSPATVQGKSLLPVIRGEQASVRDSIFCAYRDSQRMVCNETWKLIVYPKIGRQQFFNLGSDPDELRDLSAGADYHDRITDMMQQLLVLQRQAGDPLQPVQ